LVPATLRDVAKLAGVSSSTASRALHGDGARSVAADTQERIREAVRQLQYEPNAAAREMAHRADGPPRRTASVGLILGTVAYKFSDPYWSPVIDGIDEELIRQGYHLQFTFTINDLKHRRQRRMLSHAHVDGLILAGGMRPFGDAIGRARTVVVEGGDDLLRRGPALTVDVIAAEKPRAMGRLVDHLVALGHRRMAFLGPAPERDERAEGFVQALHRHGLPCDPALLVASPWPTEDAYPIADALLAERGHTIDAIVCGCDTIAIGAMRAARGRGMRLPDDLAITGFDDIPFARDTDPALTTVRVPKALMGELAARKLIERLANPTLSPIVQIVPTTLVVRASCGAPAEHPPGSLKGGDRQHSAQP